MLLSTIINKCTGIFAKKMYPGQVGITGYKWSGNVQLLHHRAKGGGGQKQIFDVTDALREGVGFGMGMLM